MTTYRLVFPLDEFAHYRPEDDSSFDGTAPLAPLWKPQTVYQVGDVARQGDVAKLSAFVFAVNRTALRVIQPLLPTNAEVLPIETPHGPRFAIRTLEVVPALSAQSTIEYYDDGEIAGVERYEIDEDVARGHHLFRLPETQDLEVFVSSEFKRAFEQAGLSGAVFKAPNWTPWDPD